MWTVSLVGREDVATQRPREANGRQTLFRTTNTTYEPTEQWLRRVRQGNSGRGSVAPLVHTLCEGFTLLN